MRKKTEDQKSTPADETGAQPRAGTGGDAAASADEADQLAQLREERARLEDQLRRTMADLQNFRKRQLREFEEVRRRTLEALAMELLPVLDNFHLALEAHEAQHGDEPEIHTMVEGLRMVQTLLHAALERHGVSEIPAAGIPFDPTRHEAVGIEPRDDLEPGHVAAVVRRGYHLGDKVIRPSRVTVAGGAEEDAGGAEPAGESDSDAASPGPGSDS